MIFIIWLNAEIMDLMNLSGADLRFNGRLAGVGAGAINALEEGDKSRRGWNTEFAECSLLPTWN